MMVSIGEKMYQMNKDAFKKLLGVASDAVPFGIFCLQKGAVADMAKIKPESRKQLKEMVRGYRSQGYKVHYNGLQHKQSF